MKRILCLILALALLFLTPAAVAEGEGMLLHLEGSTGNVGDEVTVVGSVKNAPDCASFRVILTYDDTVLEPVSCVKGDCSGMFMSNLKMSYAGKKAVNALSAAVSYALSGDMTLFTFTFKIIGESPEDYGTLLNVVHQEFFTAALSRVQPAVVEYCRVYVGDDQPAGTDYTDACGENVSFALDPATGAMTLSGTGAMEDYHAGSAPWSGAEIRSVIVEEGVTSIGNYAFYSCTDLKEVVILNADATIGTDAFSGCPKVTLIGHADSPAQCYAAENGLAFTLLEDLPSVGLSLVSTPAQTVYGFGDPLNTAGMVVQTELELGPVLQKTGNFTVSGYDPLKPGNQTVTVHCGGRTVTFEVKVVDNKSTAAVVLIMQQVIGLNTQPEMGVEWLDQNGDGRLSIVDAVILLRSLS